MLQNDKVAEELFGLVPYHLTSSKNKDQSYPLQYGDICVLEDLSVYEKALQRIWGENQQIEAVKVILLSNSRNAPAWRITVNTPMYVANEKAGVEFIHSLPSSFGLVIVAEDWHAAAECLIELLKKEHPDWDCERHYMMTVKANHDRDRGRGGIYSLFSFIQSKFVWELKNQ